MPEQTFKRGDQIRDTYNGRTGYATGKSRPYGNNFLWQVGFGDTDLEWIQDAYLEPITEDDDMFSLFEQYRFSGVLDLRRKIQQIRLNDYPSNFFYSMHNSETEFKSYQFKPVMKFIESATGRLLIADEVGLGKTIEAIYIWKELLTRENAKRLLIVCPAQLRDKWLSDLKTRFNITTAEIVDPKKLLERLDDTLRNYSNESFVLITSIQGIRYKEKEKPTSRANSSASKLNDLFENNNQELFDLVIIDEAHYLRNSSTASFNTGEKLRDNSRYMILLSATPIQTHSENLYNLLRLLSPEDYYDPVVFDELLKENRSIIMLARAIRNNHSKDEIRILYDNIKDKLNENLSKNILAYINNQNNNIEENAKDRMSLFQILKDSNFYNQHFTRTRKRDVDEEKRERSAQTVSYYMAEDEYNIYHKVTQYLNKLSKNSSISKIFTLIARQRQMTSCLPAALKHWKDNDVMQEVLYEDLGIDDGDENTHIQIDDNILQIENLDTLMEKIAFNDSKYKNLKIALDELLTIDPKEKIIIFSFYRYTISYLYEHLTDDGYGCVKIMGGMGDEKNNIIDHFRDTPNCNILISSEVGSEGIDLQFASVEINYDLPWNPMRIEQRIGRIDRIGQKKDKIRILNFICQNTIEDRVIERLYERIDIFKYAIGDIEEILGDKIQQISIDLLTSDLDEEEKKKKADEQIDIIANNKIEMERLEEQAVMSTEFSDSILEYVKNADENKRYIMPEELIQYTYDFFTNYNGTRIERNDANSLRITLSSEAKSDFLDFIRENHYRVANLGYQNDRLLCIFNGKRDLYKKWQIVEMIDINHPFIKWMRVKNADNNKNSYDCSAIKIKNEVTSNIKKGIYVYYIQKWNSEGYRSINELKYFVIDTETKDIMDENISEKFVINSMNNGEDYLEIKFGLNNFDAIVDSLNKCKEYATSVLIQFDSYFKNENKIICEKNIQYLEMTYSRKKMSIVQQLEKARQNGQPERIIRMHEGKLTKAENTYNIQLKRLEKKKESRCKPIDIAVGLIKVED